MIKDSVVTNIIVSGVGGQGSILTSHLLADAALIEGFDVKLAETFGAATRGGSVYAHVRIGEVWAPMMREDEADVVISLEPLEGLRVATKFLKPGGCALINTHPWYPVDVTVGRVKYPSLDAITDALKKLDAKVITIDATSLAIEAGDSRSLNSVVLGGLIALEVTPISQDGIFKAMQEKWKEHLVKINQKAFQLGYDFVKSVL
ncbi:MAG TPA: indolepyruvate oxidoreductase subunit beta [Anaerolineaceae bacterium]|nr:indolepyruvate oxidoreductase subunit beta [Anaerolineaceae bacterium]HQP09187.1 indolepyruvate oxidoreductase subunit beta [Anaerolineaceae bacterium]